ncbi:hypothetical protein ACTFIY_005249 [Dictyostelium cf. discoideum]
MDIDLTCLDEIESGTVMETQEYCETCHKELKTCEDNIAIELKELNSGKKVEKCEREDKVNDAQNYKITDTPESKIEVKKEFETYPISKVVSSEQSLVKNVVLSSAPPAVDPDCVCHTGIKVFHSRVQDPSMDPQDRNYFNLVIQRASEADQKRRSADEFLDLMKEFDSESLAYIIYSLIKEESKC